MKKSFIILVIFIFSFVNLSFAVDISEDFESNNSNFIVDTGGHGGKYSVQNGFLIIENNGGSHGFMGKGDDIVLTYNQSLNLQNHIIEFNIEEIIRKQIGGNKENVSFVFSLLCPDINNKIYLYLSGMYSGYHPDKPGWSHYNTYHGHRLYIQEYIDGKNKQLKIVDLDINKNYNFQFKIINEEGSFKVAYKNFEESNFNFVETNLRDFENVQVQFQSWSGDGGYTRKNGYGKYRVDYLKIYPINYSLVDSDGDGVIDQWDICPQTPINSYVNKKGCPANDNSAVSGRISIKGKPLTQGHATLIQSGELFQKTPLDNNGAFHFDSVVEEKSINVTIRRSLD